MRRRATSLLVAIGLAMSVSIPILGQPLTQQLDNQKKQLIKEQSSYTEVLKNLENIEISIEKLDSNIESIYTAIDKAKCEIEDTEKKNRANYKGHSNC